MIDKSDLAFEVAKGALNVAMSSSRSEEEEVIANLKKRNVRAVGVDIGGDMISSIPKIIERAVVASKRSGVTRECFEHEGSVAGATRDALTQVYPKAVGLNVGGKLSVASSSGHLTVCVFLNVGMLHLNEVVVGIGHRSIS